MSATTVFTSSESQRRWRAHMQYNYINKNAIRPCVLQVPDDLRETKPEAYTPQFVGLGPYHHFRPQVQHMGSKKRAAVLGYLKNVDINDFIKLVDKSPDGFEPKIRSCYDRYLDLDKETLAWVIIVDAMFLVHLIYSYVRHHDRLELEEHNFDDHVEALAVDDHVEELATDVLMLENQIPIILILESRTVLRQNFNKNADEELVNNFRRFCGLQSPLMLTSNTDSRDESFDTNNHILHFMYQMIVKNERPDFDPEATDVGICGAGDGPDVGIIQQSVIANKGGEKKLDRLGSRVGWFAREASSVGREILHQAVEEFNSKLSDAKSAGLTVSGNIENVSNILRNFQKALPLNSSKRSPGDDQFDIPSASRLNAILNMRFKPLPDGCGIGNIDLGKGKAILHLPVITLRANSEVILRNLMAYESASGIGPPQIRHYVDLICGLIKSEKDVQLLKGSGIIEGDLADGEIVSMCNGMKKSDGQLDDKSKIHGTVKGVNNQFNDAAIVKACRRIMKGFAGITKSLKPLFPILVLVFLAMQSFCQIYDCRRGSSYGVAAFDNLYLGELDSKARLMLPRKVYRY